MTFPRMNPKSDITMVTMVSQSDSILSLCTNIKIVDGNLSIKSVPISHSDQNELITNELIS